MKKLVDVDEAVWKRFEIVAVAKFGLYGAVTKGVNEAIEDWVKKGEREER